MKKYYFVIILVAVGFVVSISSCKKDDDGPVFEESVILIDSITHADTVALGGTLSIKFYGEIGDGCDYFSRFEDIPIDAGEYENSFKIKIWRKTETGVACTEELKYLDGSAINLTGMLAGKFVIKVFQPDDSFIESEVFIKE